MGRIFARFSKQNRKRIEHRVSTVDLQFTYRSAYTYSAGTRPGPLEVVDVNSDNKPGIIIGNNDANTASILLNADNRTFLSQTNVRARIREG